MYEYFAINRGLPLSETVGAIWCTLAEAGSYSRHEHRRADSPMMTAVRTVSGEGVLRIAAGREYRLPADSLLLVPTREIVMYTCFADTWELIWCEFLITLPFSLRIRESVRFPGAREDLALARRCVQGFRATDAAGRLRGTADFLNLLARWIPALTTGEERQPAVTRAQSFICANLHRKLTSKDIAASVHMGERSLRCLFLKECGLTPLQFAHREKLRAAGEYLRHTSLNVAEIAEALAFSSPFHLSRAYAQWFGHPPGAERRRT